MGYEIHSLIGHHLLLGRVGLAKSLQRRCRLVLVLGRSGGEFGQLLLVGLDELDLRSLSCAAVVSS